METKPDFAQKLLRDLRLRKERMAASQSSRGHFGSTSRDMHGNQGETYRGSQQINTIEYVTSRIGNSVKSNAGNSLLNLKESTNQIVIYGKGKTPTQDRDLSMAIAFAFENGGKLSKISASSSNPLVYLFNRFGRRSIGSQKMDITSSHNGSGTFQLANVSQINTTEISRGVQKLNKILKAYSSGMNLDRDSIKIGNELLRGAIDLEESLTILANLQESSEYMNGGHKKNHIKLLEEGEDQEDTGKNVEDWQLDRPRFSFDKPLKDSCTVQGNTKKHSKRNVLAISYLDKASKQPGSSSKMVTHKQSASWVQDLSSVNQVKPNKFSSSSHLKQEKGRISNVIAKLMGLEEIPPKEDSTSKQIDSKGNEGKKGKILNKSTNQSESLNRDSMKDPAFSTDMKSIVTNNSRQIRENKQGAKSEMGRGTPERGYIMVSSDANKHRKDSKILAVDTGAGSSPRVAVCVVNRQQSHTIAGNQIKGSQTSENTEKKHKLPKDGERKTIETQKIIILTNEVQHKKQNNTELKFEETAHSRIESKVNANYLKEKRNAKEDLQSTQLKTRENDMPIHLQVTGKPEHYEDKHRVEPKIQQLQKQTLQEKKQSHHQIGSTVSSTSKKTSMAKLENKLSCDKSLSGNVKFIQTSEKVLMEDLENSEGYHDTPTIENSENVVANQENLKTKDQSQISSPKPRDPNFDKENGSSGQLLKQAKPTDGSSKQRKNISRKVQKNENPRKIDALVNQKRIANHLMSSRKQSTSIMQELKQQLHNKNCSSKRIEQHNDSKAKEGEHDRILSSALEKISETQKEQGKSRIQDEAAEQTIPLNSIPEDECTTQNILDTSISDDNGDNISKSGKVPELLQQAEQPYGLEDKQEKMQHEKRIGDHETSSELLLSQHKYGQYTTSRKQEQLTQPEMDLKEIIIKSHLFLNTAEALFKLNIPTGFLHASDHTDDIVDKTLIVHCGCEIMKRKARRHDMTLHLCKNPSTHFAMISSLDDLVKQLHKEFEILKFYGGSGSTECDIADGLHKMLNRDIYNMDPDVNTMWDSQWNNIMFMFPEKEYVVKDIEKHMLNELLDEITNDLLVTTASV